MSRPLRAGGLAGALAMVLAVALAGCSFGMGSAYVGQWRPRQEVAFEACLLDGPADGPPGVGGAPRCRDRKQVTVERPPRKFWGVILPLLALGGAKIDYQGKATTDFTARPTLELLRGFGRWAYGVRVGAILESVSPRTPAQEDAGAMAALDVSVVGHVAVLERVSLYGGLGYLPYATVFDQSTWRGGHGFVGAQLALSQTQGETIIVLSLELDRSYLQLDEAYRSTALVGHLGIFF